MARKVEIEVVVSADGAIKGVRNLSGDFAELGTTVDTAAGRASRFGKVMDVALGNLAANAVPALLRGLQRSAGAVLDLGTSFEQQLADLEAITGITGADLEDLGDTAVDESVRTGVAAREQVEAYKLLASNIDIATAGGVEGLKRLGRETVLLAQASGVDLATAASTVAGAINQFQLEASESARVVNVLAAGAKFGAAEIPDLSEALVNVGASASGANVSLEQTTAALEVLAQSNLKGARAGTQLRGVITTLRTKSEELAKAGIKDVNVETDGLTGTLEKLQPLLGDASALTDLFGEENINAAETLIRSAGAVEEMTGKVTGTNTAAEQAAKQMNTLRGDIGKLYTTVRAIALDGYAAYQDELRGVIQLTTDIVRWLGENTGAVMGTLKAVVALTAGLVTFNATMRLSSAQVAAWNIVTRSATLVQAGMTLATSAGKRAMQLFNATVRANPLGLLASVVATVASYFLLFRKGSDEATESLKEQRAEVQGLTEDLEELSGAQLFQKTLEIKTNLEETNERLRETATELEALRAAEGVSTGRQMYFRVEGEEGLVEAGERNRRIADLQAEQNRLKEKGWELSKAISDAEARGADNIEYKITQLEAEQTLLANQANLTEGQQARLQEVNRLLAEQEELLRKRKAAEDDSDDSEQDAAAAAGAKADAEERALTAIEKARGELDKYRAQLMTLKDADLGRLIAMRRQTEEVRKQLDFYEQMVRKSAEDIEIASPRDPELDPEALQLQGVDRIEEDLARARAAVGALESDTNLTLESIAANAQQAAGNFAHAFQTAFEVAGGANSKFFALFKAFAVAEAIASTYLAANKALASAPPPFNFALAAGVVAAGLANVAKIVSTRPPSQAGASGGTSAAQERTRGPARVPQFGRGVTGFEGGAALVGEEGPELVTLGRGSNVITNENLQALRAGLQVATSQAAYRAQRRSGGTDAALLKELRATREVFARKQFVLRGANLETQQTRQQAIYDDAGIK